MGRTQKTEIDDTDSQRNSLIQSTAGLSDLSGKRGWIFIEEHQEASENGPVSIAVNSWNTALTRGIWINVPFEAKEVMSNALARKYKVTGYNGGLPVREPYEARSFPFQWESEFDAGLMGSNWFDPRNPQDSPKKGN